MIPKRLRDRLDDLAMFPDRADRIQALIALAEEYKHPGLAEVARTESARVPGCESEVFVGGEAGRVRIAVDNPQGVSAQALAVLLEDGLKDAPKDEIESVSEELVYDVFGRELSMGKSLGLTNTVRMAKRVAAGEA